MRAALDRLEQVSKRLSPAHLSGPSGGSVPEDSVELSEEMVSLLEAREQFQLSLSLHETAQEMLSEALELLRRFRAR